MTRPDIRNAPDLLLNVLRQFSDLLRSEAELAKSELKEKASNARDGAIALVAAVIVALVALHVLAAALVAWIATLGIGPGLAAMIVGGALLVVCLGLLLFAKSRLSSEALTPTRTIENAKRDAARIKEAAHVRY